MKRSLVVLLTLATLCASKVALAASQPPAEGITVLESGASYRFAQDITFTLRVAPTSPIESAYLFFRATADEQTVAVDVPVEESATADSEVEVQYVYEVRQHPMPPFTTVIFWWQLEDSAGNRSISQPQEFSYTDNRFEWDHLSTGNVTVHWIRDRAGPAFGQTALDLAGASLSQISADLRAPIPPRIEIVIYDDARDLEGAMMLAGREWVTGQSHPELGVVLIAIPSREGYTSQMRRDIPHELSHLLVYQSVSPSGYRNVPTWLDEGLATAHEERPTPEYQAVVDEARQAGQLIPLADLCEPFSPDSSVALLSYAQSGSLVEFIRERFGAQGVRSLLAVYANGASCSSGVQDALGMSLTGLDVLWQNSLVPESPWQMWIRQVGIWVGVWVVGLAVSALMVGRLRSDR